MRGRSVNQDDEIQVEVEVRHEARQALASDGDDTLNNIRLPSLENDEEANVERVVVCTASRTWFLAFKNTISHFSSEKDAPKSSQRV